MSKESVKQQHVLLLLTIVMVIAVFLPSDSRILAMLTETPRRFLDSVLGQTTWPLHQMGLRFRPEPKEYRLDGTGLPPAEMLLKQIEQKDAYILKLEHQLKEAADRYADSVLLHDILNQEGLRFLDARVSRRSSGTNVTALSIRRGSQDGVSEGLVVVSTTNLVGKISQISYANSTVLPAIRPGERMVLQITPASLDRHSPFPDIVLSAVVDEKGTYLEGVLREDIPVKPGFLAHLHRTDPSWPQEAWGLIVAVVESIQPDPMDPISSRLIKLRPAVMPHALNKVTVIVPVHEAEDKIKTVNHVKVQPETPETNSGNNAILTP